MVYSCSHLLHSRLLNKASINSISLRKKKMTLQHSHFHYRFIQGEDLFSSSLLINSLNNSRILGKTKLSESFSKLNERTSICCKPRSQNFESIKQKNSSNRFAPKVKAWSSKINFCISCGSAMVEKVPEGEKETRCVCCKCNHIHYQNPKMVVGCLIEHDRKVLLCRRRIEPRSGFWTLPGGFMELGESAAEGAVRETWEEANAEVEIVAPFAHIDIPLIGQSYIIFRAKFIKFDFSPGPETLETSLFLPHQIPFDQIAFSAITVTLQKYVEDVKNNQMHIHMGVIDKKPGVISTSPESFSLRDYIGLPLK